MALAAQLYRDARNAERHRVDFDATLRDPAFQPIDVVIEDLSATGLRVVTRANLAMGVEVGLGLAGIGTHRARVVRRGDGNYGCEFVTPLTSSDLAIALSAPSTAPVSLPNAPWAAPAPADPRRAVSTGLSPRGRLFAIVACALAAWVVAAALGAFVVRLVDLAWPR